MAEPRHGESGFTLIELLIAVTVLVIVTAQLFMVFSSQKRTFSASQRTLDVQEDARLVLDLIAFDARMAGFMVPRIAGISSEDGGTAASDRLCVSDPGYFPYPQSGDPATQLDSRGEHFTTTGVSGVGLSSVVVNTLDIDGSQTFAGTGPNDFTAGAGLIVSNGQRTVCAEIESINEGTRTLTLDKDYAALLGMANLALIRVAPALIYEVDGVSNTLTRNGLTLATSVEDLQVEYWVDNLTRNGVIDGAEFPVHDLNAAPAGGWTIDTSRIRRVRVSVLTRTDMREVNPDGTEKITGYAGRPALANRNAAAVPDGFQRRRFVASVMPKNLM
jgi:prepilin-type N-terminal cleavage/methylation domain-containing protein